MYTSCRPTLQWLYKSRDNLQATTESALFQEHTYAMCPGCPTFSIPIPIPKEAMEFAPAPAATAGHAPEEVRRNGQLGLQPEYYAAREKVIVDVSTWIEQN